jgi:hypothetical protein
MKAIRQNKELKAVYLVATVYRAARSWSLRHGFEKLLRVFRIKGRTTTVRWSNIKERQRWLDARSRMNAEAKCFSKFL